MSAPAAAAASSAPQAAPATVAAAAAPVTAAALKNLRLDLDAMFFFDMFFSPMLVKFNS